jgi:NAD+ diphosphatase
LEEPVSKFRPKITHVYAGNPLDRGEAQRRDEQWLGDRARDAASKFLPMRDLNVPIVESSGARLGWLSAEDLNRLEIDGEAIFLGLLENVAHFVVDVPGNGRAAAELEDTPAWRYEDARTATEFLSGEESGIVAHARAHLDWHKRHGFCSVCGCPTAMGRGGQVRRCPGCKSEHFPRTDPVAITVVADGDRCLLGQSRGRLARLRSYSALAGFIDQAESIEEAVAREIMEEAGIEVTNVRYHSSQPWPFPSSLMIGCHADAVTTEIRMDPEEMTDVRWFHRDEVLLALDGKSAELTIPGPIAIAHHLIKAWATGSVS